MKNKAKRINVEKDTEETEEIPVNRDSVKDSVFEIAVDMFALGESDRENFEELELEYDVKCDALDIVEFVMNLEDEFGVIISEEESDKLVTFEDCIDLIWGKLASENSQTYENGD